MAHEWLVALTKMRHGTHKNGYMFTHILYTYLHIYTYIHINIYVHIYTYICINGTCGKRALTKGNNMWSSTTSCSSRNSMYRWNRPCVHTHGIETRLWDCYDSFMWETWLVHDKNMTHWWETWLIVERHDSFMRDMPGIETRLWDCCDSFMWETWLIHDIRD